jgi:lipopolysaccharide transport system ATP-binding protein
MNNEEPRTRNTVSTVIKVENISKQYRLGVISAGTLRDDVQRWWHKVRGLEDPLSRVDSQRASEAPRTKNQEQSSADILWALRDVSFEVKQGEVLGIIGRNGAGKSTLLKILSRVTAPTQGTIRVRGRIASLLEVGTGFHPELTGRENILLNGAILGMTRHEVRKKMDEIIAFAEVERFVDTPVKRYSSGMYVRLAFAVAAHLDPEIMIVDEVLAVGDLSYQNKCIEKMGQLSRDQGKTILFVSHNLKIIENLCSRVIVLVAGQIAAQGSVQDSLTYYYQKQAHAALIRTLMKDRIEYIGTSLVGGDHVNIAHDLHFDIRISTGPIRLNDLEIDLAVLNQRDEYVLHTRSSYLIPTLMIDQDHAACVSFVFEKPRLAPGTYHVTVFMAIHNQAICWVEHAVTFIVSAVSDFGVTKDFPLLRAPVVPKTTLHVDVVRK